MKEVNYLTTEVVVIGAGPAGSTCAYLLKKAGVDCMLFDQAEFPRDKICGGGLTVKSYTLLQELMPQFHYDYKSIKKVRLLIDNKNVCEFEPSDEVRIVGRKEFDYALLQQYIQIGGQFERGSFSKYEEQSDGKILVTLKSGKQILCKYLVGADGANSQVRKQAAGDYDGSILVLEQYVEKTKDVIEVELSNHYDNGYYYWFPSVNYDVVGYADYSTNFKRFREILKEKCIAETKIKGAYIPLKDVKSDNNHIILIGDAGGFANKITAEGLYYAFATGRNAYRAITENIPFIEANKAIFKKKKNEVYWAKLFYSRLGLLITRCFAHNPNLIKKIYDKGVFPDRPK
jgi:flavin-dependent dehydrogenase